MDLKGNKVCLRCIQEHKLTICVYNYKLVICALSLLEWENMTLAELCTNFLLWLLLIWANHIVVDTILVT